MLDFLERKRLHGSVQFSSALLYRQTREGGVRTTNFSVIPATPWTEEVSKVSMELSRCSVRVSSVQWLQDGMDGTNVETGEALTVGVKGVVVELDELF